MRHKARGLLSTRGITAILLGVSIAASLVYVSRDSAYFSSEIRVQHDSVINNDNELCRDRRLILSGHEDGDSKHLYIRNGEYSVANIRYHRTLTERMDGSYVVSVNASLNDRYLSPQSLGLSRGQIERSIVDALFVPVKYHCV